MRIKIDLSVNKAIQILLFFLFIINFSVGLFAPFFAIYITEFIKGATFKTVGFAIAIFAIAKSIVQIPAAKFLDKYDGEKDEFFAILIGGIITIIYPFILFLIKTPLHLYLIEIFVGIGDGFLMAAYYSLFSKHTDKGSEGFEWSLFSVGGLTIAAAISGAIGGQLADSFGIKTLFLIAGFLNMLAISVIFLLYPYLDTGKKRKAEFPPIIP